jgi:hypothetical protein
VLAGRGACPTLITDPSLSRLSAVRSDNYLDTPAREAMGTGAPWSPPG